MQTRPPPGKAGSGPPTQLRCAKKPASRLTWGQRDAGYFAADDADDALGRTPGLIDMLSGWNGNGGGPDRNVALIVTRPACLVSPTGRARDP